MTWRNPIALGTLLVGALALPACDGTEADVITTRVPTSTAKLIAGSDTPTGAAEIAELHRNLAAAEAQPFDGLVVDVLGAGTGSGVRDVWAATALLRAPRQAAVNELRAIPFRKLTDNFQRLGLPGREMDWFSDPLFATIASNWTTAAALVKESGLRGFFIDNQVYGSGVLRIFSHPNLNPAHSFAEYEQKIAARGEAIMDAAISAFPDISVLVNWGFSEVFRQVCIEGQPLETHPYGLYPALLDGMLRAISRRRSGARLIDAYLPAYPTKMVEAFPVFYNLIHLRWDAMVEAWKPGIVTHWDLMPPKASRWRADAPKPCSGDVYARLGRELPAGFGLMMDYESPRGFSSDPALFAQNHFTPEAFEASLTAALRTTDRYVWIWQESFTWWGIPRQGRTAGPPPAYGDAIARARKAAGRVGP